MHQYERDDKNPITPKSAGNNTVLFTDTYLPAASKQLNHYFANLRMSQAVILQYDNELRYAAYGYPHIVRTTLNYVL